MEVLFESRLNLSAFVGALRFIQEKPTIHAEPVLRPDTFADRNGASIYGTVLNEGGVLRMWYQAWPENWDFRHDVANVAYAESTDGIDWKKPALGLVNLDNQPNNLCNFGLHSPSLFIDPSSPGSQRYRGTGYANVDELFPSESRPCQKAGYYTLHSADGLDWKSDGETPQWDAGDVITSIYHPQQQRGLVALKRSARIQRIDRRCINTADFAEGRYSLDHTALYPDEYDDVVAMNQGYASGDYYGMGMLAAGSGTVGFLWNFKHLHPYIGPYRAGFYGPVDVTLVYQPERGGKWFHFPGRRSFIESSDFSWMGACVYTASSPVEFGDEHRLYFTVDPLEHGYYIDEHWKRVDRWADYAKEHGRVAIGFASWPKFRIFGIEASRDGSFVMEIEVGQTGVALQLNYKVFAGGSVRAEVLDAEDRSLADSVPLTGDNLAETVAWRKGSEIQAATGTARVKLHLELAIVYAYTTTPV